MTKIRKGEGNTPEDGFRSLFDMATDHLRRKPKHHLQRFFVAGRDDVLASGVVRACLRCEVMGPEAPRKLLGMILRAGDDRNLDALLQALAEVYVLSWLASIDWPGEAEFAYEPGTKKGKKPELRVRTAERSYLFEVKAPSFGDFQLRRHARQYQLLSRSVRREDLDYVTGGEKVTPPLDNKLKDFLQSAEEKFVGMKQAGDLAYLVVVWDSQLQEPVTALSSPFAGLLTSRTFARNAEGAPMVFPSVDGVLLVSRLELLRNALLSAPTSTGPDVMDHAYQEPLPTGLARRSGAPDVPPFLVDQLHVEDVDQPNLPIAELQSTDFVYWPRAESAPSDFLGDAGSVHVVVKVHGSGGERVVDLSRLPPKAALELIELAIDADFFPGLDPDEPLPPYRVEIEEGDRIYRRDYDPLAPAPGMKAFLDGLGAIAREPSA